ncbi:MAG: hypothetical protein HFJ59_04620 [Clostridia bacterium]|nr:hypothetical protein [Clostridia bacterium]
MEKINFKNGQAPYINDTNLNQLQENIEESINSKSSLPTGGITGQVLAKASNTDNDVEWVNQTSGGESSIVVEDTLESDSITNALSANQGKELNEKIKNMTTYSAEEINTGKTWIDGKTIYRRILNIPNVTSTGSLTSSNVSLENIDYETITEIKAIAKLTSNDWVAIPYVYQSNFLTIALNDTKKLYVYTIGYSTSKITAIIEYTKTTD